MSSSGVKVVMQCQHMYDEVKMNRKQSKKRKFAVFKVSDDDREIIPDDDFMEKDFDDFLDLVNELPQKDGRYVIWDYSFVGTAGQETSKLILMLWCPNGVAIKKKMLYASSKGAVKSMMRDNVPEFQCDGPGDINHDEIIRKVKK